MSSSDEEDIADGETGGAIVDLDLDLGYSAPRSVVALVLRRCGLLGFFMDLIGSSGRANGRRVGRIVGRTDTRANG